jgi:hypothetical protein
MEYILLIIPAFLFGAFLAYWIWMVRNRDK